MDISFSKVQQMPDDTPGKDRHMYSVWFKEANLKQRFTMTARAYRAEAFTAVQNAIKAEHPEASVLSFWGGRSAFVENNDTLSGKVMDKIKALPFVRTFEALDPSKYTERSAEEFVAHLHAREKAAREALRTAAQDATKIGGQQSRRDWLTRGASSAAGSYKGANH